MEMYLYMCMFMYMYMYMYMCSFLLDASGDKDRIFGYI